MSSQARKNFDNNFEDIEHLIGMGKGMLALDEADGECSEEEINVLLKEIFGYSLNELRTEERT